MNAPLSHPLSSASVASDWMQDRLIEARGILADVPQHPESLVILAARVVAGQTDDSGECADAIDLLRQDFSAAGSAALILRSSSA